MENGFRAGSEVFLSYKNDDGSIKQGFFILVQLTDSYIIVKTQTGSELLLPISQVLKLKKRGQNGS